MSNLYVMLCYAMLCYATLRYATLHNTEDERSSARPQKVFMVMPQVAMTRTHDATSDDKGGQTKDP